MQLAATKLSCFHLYFRVLCPKGLSVRPVYFLLVAAPEVPAVKITLLVVMLKCILECVLSGMGCVLVLGCDPRMSENLFL